MPKNPHPGRVKMHSVYTPAEAAEALDVHRQTVLQWIKTKGLAADCSRRPWLIDGAVLKVFLAERRAAGKCPVRLEQIYCLPCRRAQLPDGRLADFKLTGIGVGMLMGLCPDCGRLMHKRVRRGNLEQIRALLDVTVQKAEPRIMGSPAPSQTVTSNTGARTHGKARLG